ncbi:MAG: T9SS type A sorting domain-containing protein [Bacteroidales bacterium]|nr:T9SS type A sorting domain-containing protein [Bacteroidales bacterium]
MLKFKIKIINADYQWIDCETMLPIEGEISQSLYPSSNGNYAVEITQEGCVDTSDCYYIEILDIAKYDISTNIKMYPNPTDGIINLELDKDFKDSYIIVRNVLGEDILKKHFSSSYIQFEITGVKGMYFIEIYSVKYRQTIKVIKN